MGKQCIYCGSQARFKCSCSIRYCSKECQKLDWHEHKIAYHGWEPPRALVVKFKTGKHRVEMVEW